MSSKKQRSHHVSLDSDSESNDVSSGCDKEPASRRSYKRLSMCSILGLIILCYVCIVIICNNL